MKAWSLEQWEKVGSIIAEAKNELHESLQVSKSVVEAEHPRKGWEGTFKAEAGVTTEQLIESITSGLPTDKPVEIGLFDHMGRQIKEKAKCFGASGSYIAIPNAKHEGRVPQGDNHD